MAYWVISDIHGCEHTCRNLVDAVLKEDITAEFIFGGDYVDRGSKTKGTIDFLLELKQQVPCVFLRGNHDDLLMTALGQETYSFYTIDNSYHVETALSYGTPLRTNLREFVPDSHIQFFRGLLPAFVHDDFFVIHAWYPPNMEAPNSINDINPLLYNELLWYRFSDRKVCWKKLGIFGHTPTNLYGSRTFDPIIDSQIAFIDCGACFGRKLAAFNPQSRKYITVEQDIRDRVNRHVS